MTKEQELIVFKDDELEIEVNVSPQEETVWLTQDQLAKLFEKNKSTISRHLKNIFDSGELDRNDSVAKNATELNIVDYRSGKMQKVERVLEYYNLDVILSIGYKVNSKRGVILRKWANQILKKYIYQGYAIDQERLTKHQEYYKAFTTSVKLIADLIERKKLEPNESKNLLHIISKYAYALETLDKYDHQSLTITNITNDTGKIKLVYEDAIKEIKGLPDYGKTQWFGKEKDHSFHGALNAIYQTALGEEVYPSIEEKAANLLYFIVKDHAFYDGNKRIAASVFLWFLDIYGVLYKKDGSRILDDNALVAIVLMIALSHPNERDIIVKIIINLINQNN
jgi:prophage maintenance system killer protein/Zn-finger nucleic acid-binding protein